MQNKIFVLDSKKRPLSPCHPAKARRLLDQGKAAVFRRYPFTIILKYEVEDAVPVPCEVKIDPGARTSGIVVVQHNQTGPCVVWAAEVQHKGHLVKDRLETRRQLRRSRRSRKTRYRQPRFSNRRRPKGWLPPSLMSRVRNIFTWARRLCWSAPVQGFTVEQVKFDTQLMENPDIAGIEYQQGTLWGYEVKEYLLERDGRRCAYCDKTSIPLEIEHIIPRSCGGTNRITNLTLACTVCNQAKGSQTAAEFGYPAVQNKVTQRSLRGVAAVNATRNKIVEVLEQSDLPVWTGTGGQTKFNRTQNGYPKAHWIDAACTGPGGDEVWLDPALVPLAIKAIGRGKRQMCGTNKYGFPTRHRKRQKKHFGFQTGDIVRAIVPRGINRGTHIGRALCRASGSFDIATPAGRAAGISYRHCRILHHSDGYQYAKGASAVSSQA